MLSASRLHGEGFRAFRLQEGAGGGDDLPGPVRHMARATVRRGGGDTFSHAGEPSFVRSPPGVHRESVEPVGARIRRRDPTRWEGPARRPVRACSPCGRVRISPRRGAVPGSVEALVPAALALEAVVCGGCAPRIGDPRRPPRAHAGANSTFAAPGSAWVRRTRSRSPSGSFVVPPSMRATTAGCSMWTVPMVGSWSCTSTT